MSSTTSHDECVVVLKNLPFESSTHDIEGALKSRKFVSVSIDRKVDAAGHFRGTAFVRFEDADKAARFVEQIDQIELIICGRRAKAELMRKSTRGRSYSAKEILEAGAAADARAVRVRNLITNFVYSDKMEVLLPSDLDADDRKLAHSLGEKFGLLHETRQDESDSLQRRVYMSKSRTNGHKPDRGNEQYHRSKSLLKSNRIVPFASHMHPIIPIAQVEVPVFAIPPQSIESKAKELDQIALMHARQAQVHAKAAQAALAASRRSREEEILPPWLELVEVSKFRSTNSLRSSGGSFMNRDAPEFVPTSILGTPPGLSRIR